MSVVRNEELEYVRAIMHLGPDNFVEQFPGTFMIAMGLVSAEIADGRGRGARGDRTMEVRTLGRVEAQTVRIEFGDSLTHAVSGHPLAGRVFFMPDNLKGRSLMVGRGSGVDVKIPHTSVSKRHCRMDLLDEGLQITDLDSTNGTAINLIPLEEGVPSIVEDEGILTIGRYSFQVYQAASLFRALQLLGNTL